MDPVSNFSSLQPTYNSFLDSDPLLLALQAQQLIQHIGWTYYTIWKEVTTHNFHSDVPASFEGLAWSRGDVNRSLLADYNVDSYSGRSELITHTGRPDRQQNKACNVGLLLQQFYKQCSFLPMGLGIAGEAISRRQHQWASAKGLWLQISSLSTFNNHPAPLDLQENLFQTVVCIPLQKGGGVLEIGTKELVPETDGMLSHIRAFINGLGTNTLGAEEIINPALRAAGSVLPYNVGEQDKHNDSFKWTQTYDSRAMRRQLSISSSYCSSSSATSSSPHSVDQRASSHHAPFIQTNPVQTSSVVDNDDMHNISPCSSIDTTPTISMDLNSLNQLGLLNQMCDTDVRRSNTVPTFTFQLKSTASAEHPAPSSHVSHDVQLSGPSLNYSSTSLASLPGYGTQYNQPQNEPKYHSFSFESLRQQPMQSDNYIARNDNLDDSHSSQSYPQEIMGGGASHTASHSNDQQHQWSKALSTMDTEGGRTIHFLNQSEDEVLPVSMMFAAGHRASYSLGAYTDVKTQEECAALTVETERQIKRRSLKGETPITALEAFHGALTPANFSYDDQEDKLPGVYTVKPGVSPATAGDVSGYRAPSMSDLKDQEAGNAPRMLEPAGIGRNGNIKKPAMALSPSVNETSASYHRGAFEPWQGSLRDELKLKKKSMNEEGSALTKHMLRSYLPVLQDEMVGRGSAGLAANVQYNMNNPSTSGMPPLQQGEVHEGDDDRMIGSISAVAQNEAAVQHMVAERNRRRKQQDCFKALRTVVPNITKKDKVAILQRTIEYIKEIQGNLFELEKEKSLLSLKTKACKDATKRFDHDPTASHAHHPISEKSSCQNMSLEPRATCRSIPSLGVNQAMLQFQLDLNINVEDIKDTNDTMNEMICALQKRNLHCIELNSKYDMSTSNFNVTIMATYKEAENLTSPSLDKIQEIEEWWPYFIKDYSSPKQKP